MDQKSEMELVDLEKVKEQALVDLELVMEQDLDLVRVKELELVD